MYKLIGIDGQEYGPATVEQIRQWIWEQRVDRHTRIFTQDAADWTPACLVPEFADDFPGEAPPANPSAPPPLPARVHPCSTRHRSRPRRPRFTRRSSPPILAVSL